MSPITTHPPDADDKHRQRHLETLSLLRERWEITNPNQPVPKVFNTLQYARYVDNAFAQSPAGAHALYRANGEEEHRRGVITLADLNDRFPKELSEKERVQQGVWELWNGDVPLYDPVHIYRLVGYRESFTSWRTRYDLPKLLTARQAGYLVERAVSAGAHASESETLKVQPEATRRDKLKARAPKSLPASFSSLFNWNHPKHPWPCGAVNHYVKTKVGNTYGTWRFLSCLSEDENTSGNRNVFYQATCIACGHTQEINYRKTSSPCPACMTQFRNTYKERETSLRHTVTVYYMGEGQFQLADRIPEGAKGRIVFGNRRLPHFIEFFKPEDKAAYDEEIGNPVAPPPAPEVRPTDLLPSSDMPF